MGKLLAIVEVDQDLKVYCQADGCTATVYKRVHVVDENGVIKILGGTCYSKIYGDSEYEQRFSHYTGIESRKLTPEEREMLLNNTEALIERFAAQAALKSLDNMEAPTLPQSPPQSKVVHCYYCGERMKTRANKPPVTGHKCELCLKFNRSPPNPRKGITKEKNALANRNENH
jgi:hypothetical protein